MRVIAFYLPQFHDIPENDKWWGKGFTEWVNVKKAKPLFEGHNQPRVPLNENYYDLLDDDVKIWQADLAKKYGIYGFCYYHYWFNGKLLLEKPMEQMLNNKNVDIPFCVCWANEPWTKAWVGEKKTLIAQEYGNKEEWIRHFDYLLSFFKDERYITEDNKPLVVIYRPEIIPCLNEMLDCWEELAKLNGFDGINFAYQNINFELDRNRDDSRFSYDIEFQPHYCFYDMYKNEHRFLRKIKKVVSNALERRVGINLRFLGEGKLVANRIEYSKAWEMILQRKGGEKHVAGAFVDWDNTPRHGVNGKIYIGANPVTFKHFFSAQIKNVKDNYKSDMIFMYAWNEWAEGGYLEPDETNKYGYLEAIRDALNENEEFPTRG